MPRCAASLKSDRPIDKEYGKKIAADHFLIMPYYETIPQIAWCKYWIFLIYGGARPPPDTNPLVLNYPSFPY